MRFILCEISSHLFWYEHLFSLFFDFLREDQDNDKNSDDENEGKFFRSFAENMSHLVWLTALSDHYSA